VDRRRVWDRAEVRSENAMSRLAGAQGHWLSLHHRKKVGKASGGLTSPARPVMGGGVRKTTCGVLSTVSSSRGEAPAESWNAVCVVKVGLSFHRATDGRSSAWTGAAAQQELRRPDAPDTRAQGH
jgi:hypothetical protein